MSDETPYVLHCPPLAPIPVRMGETLVLGSGEDAALRFDVPGLAEERAWITYDGANLQLWEADPEGELFLNGEEFTGRAALNIGDVISSGRFNLEVRSSTAAPAKTAPVPAAIPAKTPEPPPQEAPKPKEAPHRSLIEELQAHEPADVSSPKKHSSKPKVFRLPLYKGQETRELPLHDGMTFGRDKADVILSDPTVSAPHARVNKQPEGWLLTEMGRNPSRINGQMFRDHLLVFGDEIQIGGYHFIFTGFSFEQVSGASGCGLTATGVIVRKPNGDAILTDASFIALPGSFVGILGPSGAGKTTLMRAVAGLQPIAEGTVQINGLDLREIGDLSTMAGFVPQQDIVHMELTAHQAIRYNALLRLPKKTSRREIERRIAYLGERLGLTPHMETRVSRLSGGQLKRVNVCVELLSRPQLLFLDEPTSGLDPAAELELMKLLQELSTTGTTVICTTHVMERVYLMDSIEVVAAQRGAPGRNVFRGRPRLAKDFFGVEQAGDIFTRLPEKKPEEWQAEFRAFSSKPDIAVDIPDPSRVPQDFTPRLPRKHRHPLPILLMRQWDLLCSDMKNLWLLLGQPLLVALLISFASVSDAADSTKLFLLTIATLWFGGSNAAQEIVKEKPIFERERYTGLPPGMYLASKFLTLSLITVLQGLLMLGVVAALGNGLGGSRPWELTALVATAITSVSLGLYLSAISQTRTQAVLLVPLFVIPQILFAGFVFPLEDWKDSTAIKLVARLSPSFHAQRIMDTSLVWGKLIPKISEMDSDFRRRIPLLNLEQSLAPLRSWIQKQFTYHLDEHSFYRLNLTKQDTDHPPYFYGKATKTKGDDGKFTEAERPSESDLEQDEPFNADVDWPVSKTNANKPPLFYSEKEPHFQKGRIFAYANPAITALAALVLMTTGLLTLAWRSLRGKKLRM